MTASHERDKLVGMLEDTLQLTSHCKHLEQGVESVSTKKVDSELEAIAIIAIGNPLVEKDSKAARLLAEIQEDCSSSGRCLFSMDSSFAWIKTILRLHDQIVVVDTVSEKLDDFQGWVFSALTPDLLAQPSLAISASHGLSWLDELKFDLLENGRMPSVSFLGISSSISETNWVQMKERFKENLKLLEKGCSNA